MIVLVSLFWIAAARGADAPSITPKFYRPPKIVHEMKGTIVHDSIEESYQLGQTLTPRQAPHYYAGNHLKSGVLQKFDTFHYPDRNLYLTSEHFCTMDYDGAQLPWNCKAHLIWWGKGEGGAAEQIAEVAGDFDEVDVSPDVPLVQTIKNGCCDASPIIGVYNLKGKRVCKPVGDHEYKWPTIKDGTIVCPGPDKKLGKVN